MRDGSVGMIIRVCEQRQLFVAATKRLGLVVSGLRSEERLVNVDVQTREYCATCL